MGGVGTGVRDVPGEARRPKEPEGEDEDGESERATDWLSGLAQTVGAAGLSGLALGRGVDGGSGEACGVDGPDECFIAERSAMVVKQRVLNSDILAKKSKVLQVEPVSTNTYTKKVHKIQGMVNIEICPSRRYIQVHGNSK